jgi:hypothetical protein
MELEGGAIGGGLDVESGSHLRGSFAHVAEAVAAFGLLWIKADAVVADDDAQASEGLGDAELDVGRLCVTGDVVEGFFADQIEFAPCSTAWARVYAEKPDLALQHPQDNAHPGDAGHFLNLACFYAALTGESPVGKLPRTFHVWPHGKYEADEAKLAAFQPDAYQAKMAKWMFKHMSMNATATLDEETARYLESVAWETWQKVSLSLASP